MKKDDDVGYIQTREEIWREPGFHRNVRDIFGMLVFAGVIATGTACALDKDSKVPLLLKVVSGAATGAAAGASFSSHMMKKALERQEPQP